MRKPNPIDLRSYLEGEYRPYSGRGMYGESCQGFVYESQHAAIMDMICATSNDPDDEHLYDAFCDHRFDSMGTSVILYFPSVSVKP
jgi:hypothetical protein